MTESILSLQTSHLRLSFLGAREQATGFALDLYDGNEWHRMATTSPLSRLTYRDRDGKRQEMVFNTCRATHSDDRVELGQTQAASDGISVTFTATFALTDEPYQVAVDYRLEASDRCNVLNWLGPALYVGEGSFGAAKDAALFPGLEYLLGDEVSSDTRFAAERFARRYMPHPYKITIPLMAVSYAGRAVGLMWDPNQDWYNAWRHPAALFASPNRLEEGAQNHLLALAVPAVEPRWRNEEELEAHTPVSVRAATLSARLVVCPTGGVMGIVAAWLATYGLPPLPDPGHDYRANVELCVRSFLDVAWDEQAEGWHHTLSDPWGPRYEANLANLLWRYGRWARADPTLAARARSQVRRGVARARLKERTAAPHLDLALVYGHVADALDAAADASHKALAEQQADGSWPWRPEAVQAVADFKTAERLALMGREGDSATGFTAARARPALQYALYTGNPEAALAVRRAADWCNARTRPEGAQAWELHLHVPDVLAVPHLINLNLGVYELTGEQAYLDAACRWAWTGLPFTYLWNAYYRPIMRYGTVPVFGVTFHDVQPWFGVIVQWNGLVYAEALRRLARYRPCDGPAEWYHLAEGIMRHGMQEQTTHGPHLGMYPDAFSPVKGDEEYTWWLNPQLVGINTFPLAGLPVTPETRIVRADGRAAIHITGGATILEATYPPSGPLRLLLQDQPGADSFALLALPQPPAAITCEGRELPAVTDPDAAGQGWCWLERHRVAVLKMHGTYDTMAVECFPAQA